MMNYRLPGPDFGGFKSFAFQLVADEKGLPLILSNEVIELYLGYCAQCRIDRHEPAQFTAWLNSERDTALYATERSAYTTT